MLEKLINQKTIDIKSAKEITSAYSPQILNSRVGKILIEKVNAPIEVTSIGEIAPNFEGPSPSGEILDLSNLKGKVTIIEFWASWCRPCRVENPNLVRLYKKYNQNGFDIIGVSLDRTKEQWEQAIEDDNLLWTQVSNLSFWNDPVARRYSIRAIPQSYLIDNTGTVIGKNLRGNDLEERIKFALSLND